MLMFKKQNVVKVSDWDHFVEQTYKRPYNFQQQNGCRDRQIYKITVPSEYDEDYENDTIPEIVNCDEMGVSFKAWLERNPNKKIISDFGCDFTDMWWERNFYPNIDMVINDLYEKGLIEAGEYLINIDW